MAFPGGMSPPKDSPARPSDAYLTGTGRFGAQYPDFSSHLTRSGQIGHIGQRPGRCLDEGKGQASPGSLS